MDVFYELLKRAEKQYEEQSYAAAFEAVHAALNYLKALLDAKKQISQKTSPKQ